MVVPGKYKISSLEILDTTDNYSKKDCEYLNNCFYYLWKSNANVKIIILTGYLQIQYSTFVGKIWRA